MSSSQRLLKVFLSHAHLDAAIVHKLYKRLVDDGIDAWIDKEKLIPGQDWELEIRKAVRESDVVIVCLSQQFNRRGYRQKEVRIALDEADMIPEGEIFIIPARLEECENLESLRRWHRVDLFTKDGYEKLMLALLIRANQLGIELETRRDDRKGTVSLDNGKNGKGGMRKYKNIQRLIEATLYSRAYEESVELLSGDAESPIINLLAGISYFLKTGENKLQNNDLKIIDQYISKSINDQQIRSTALAILGCIKYGYYYLNKFYDPSPTTLSFIKEELRKSSTVDKELLDLIDPTPYALKHLGIQ